MLTEEELLVPMGSYRVARELFRGAQSASVFPKDQPKQSTVSSSLAVQERLIVHRRLLLRCKQNDFYRSC